ncbi:MAG: ATP-binding protein, partial [Beijerinckiaceae bacterium]
MKAADVSPVSAPEAAVLFAPLQRYSSLLLAVSGGPDSMALMGLAAAWAKTSGARISVATLDHGLRPEASAEADMVADQTHRLGLRHQILRWQGEKP